MKAEDLIPDDFLSLFKRDIEKMFEGESDAHLY